MSPNERRGASLSASAAGAIEAAAMVEPVVVMNFRRVVTGYRLRPNRLFVHIDPHAFREKLSKYGEFGDGVRE